MISNVAAFRDTFADREAIKDCVYLYSRGLDRCDGAILEAVFWPEARIEADRFTLVRDEFVKVAIPALREHYGALQHLIGNIVLRVDGASAVAESYFYGYQCFKGAGTAHDVVTSGRYLDRFERREDQWRIIERVVLVDWYREYADTARWTPGPLGMAVARGDRAPDDRSYAFLGMRG